ncbi:MAG: hypothetical protein AMXMBFR84_10140 [Candidatus Hydrogenedentota bacterium]
MFRLTVHSMVALAVGTGMFAYAEEHVVKPGPEAQEAAQEAMILAQPGDTILFDEGKFDFTIGLSLDVDNVTLKGRGSDKTILSFKGQELGSEGILITSNGVICEDFAVEDTKGDGIKAKGCEGITFRRVRAEWTNGPAETNGAYGFYPVESKNVLIEHCEVYACSDAGIYVGQSKNIIVRRNTVKFNVAGIEIENSLHADVYENHATQNTGGILVFDMPDLPMTGGGFVRVFNNTIEKNDTPNFAPKGNIVATVPTGTGMMIMSNENVEVFNNTFKDNQSANVLIVSYTTTGNPVKEPHRYDPYPEGVHIHSNTFERGGYAPQGSLAAMAEMTGGKLANIVWDGAVDAKKKVNGELPADKRIYIHGNEGADFINLNLDALSTGNGEPAILRDMAAHEGKLPSLPAIAIPGA